MLYLSQMLGKPVVDALGEELGRISDIAIQTGEVFPRITSFAFKGPAKTPIMVSWRKYVADFGDQSINLNVASPDLRFSYLQPDELLCARDLLNKQIVDTQGLKVVRVNDLKLSQSGRQLRLLGAETGARGLLRSLAPWLEGAVVSVTRIFGHPLPENIIAWNYMELVDRDLSAVKLSVTHKRLHELHPADVADILEQLDPQQRAKVFEHLDAQQAAETMSELGDEYQTDIIDDMSDSEASELLASMDPDDAADILGDLPYEKAEKLLWLMGVQDSRRIRTLLGYREKTAGGIMTPEFVTVQQDSTVMQTVEKICRMSEELETVHYVYTIDDSGQLTGALSLRSLVLAAADEQVSSLATRELITVQPDVDQEEVAETISKYDLLAVPVVDENNKILGIVTIDDALDVMEEEHDEDLQIAGAAGMRDDQPGSLLALLRWMLRRGMWFILWAVVALLTVMAGGFYLFAGALALAPVVLLLADNAVALSINDLLGYDGKRGSQAIFGLLGRNLGAALILAAIGLLLVFGLNGALAGLIETDVAGVASAGAALDSGGVGLATSGAAVANAGASSVTGAIAPTPAPAPSLSYAIFLLLNAGLPALLVCISIMVASVLVTLYGRRRLDKDKDLSNAAMTLLVMLLALAAQFGLTYLFTVGAVISV